MFTKSKLSAVYTQRPLARNCLQENFPERLINPSVKKRRLETMFILPLLLEDGFESIYVSLGSCGKGTWKLWPSSYTSNCLREKCLKFAFMVALCHNQLWGVECSSLHRENRWHKIFLCNATRPWSQHQPLLSRLHGTWTPSFPSSVTPFSGTLDESSSREVQSLCAQIRQDSYFLSPPFYYL